MAIADVIDQIDAEIAKLQQVKALLSSGVLNMSVAPAVKGKRGRPKGSTNAVKVVGREQDRETHYEPRGTEEDRRGTTQAVGSAKEGWAVTP